MSLFGKTHLQSPKRVVTIPNSPGGSLYRAGGAAALIAVALVLVEMIGFIASGPLPTTVDGWFTLLQDNRLLGLVDLYLLEIVAWVLFVPMFLALYKSLKNVNDSYLIIATALAFVGIADYIATNAAFNMLYLSDQFAAATTDAQRSLLLSAGQAVMATSPAAGYNMGLLLVSAAGLIISVVMLRSNVFGKATAYVGILANVIGLAYYFGLAVPALGDILLGASGLFFLAWIILVGVTLCQIGSVPQQEG
jgi:hypothetical protein